MACCQLSKHLFPLLDSLQDFQFVSQAEGMKDVGVNIRIRSQAVASLIRDERGLEALRQQLDTRANEMSQTSATTSFGAQSRGAGEMKGFTLEENKRHLAALNAILQRPENRSCADCQSSSMASRPTWASINLGVFICMRCAGIHRGLGVHISKVRSCTLDVWLPDQVAFMGTVGNEVANKFFEAHLKPGTRPHHDSIELERFIRNKYSNKDWAVLGGTWPPPAAASLLPKPVPSSAAVPAHAAVQQPPPQAASGAECLQLPGCSGSGGEVAAAFERAIQQRRTKLGSAEPPTNAPLHLLLPASLIQTQNRRTSTDLMGHHWTGSSSSQQPPPPQQGPAIGELLSLPQDSEGDDDEWGALVGAAGRAAPDASGAAVLSSSHTPSLQVQAIDPTQDVMDFIDAQYTAGRSPMPNVFSMPQGPTTPASGNSSATASRRVSTGGITAHSSMSNLRPSNVITTQEYCPAPLDPARAPAPLPPKPKPHSSYQYRIPASASPAGHASTSTGAPPFQHSQPPGMNMLPQSQSGIDAAFSMTNTPPVSSAVDPFATLAIPAPATSQPLPPAPATTGGARVPASANLGHITPSHSRSHSEMPFTSSLSHTNPATAPWYSYSQSFSGAPYNAQSFAAPSHSTPASSVPPTWVGPAPSHPTPASSAPPAWGGPRQPQHPHPPLPPHASTTSLVRHSSPAPYQQAPPPGGTKLNDSSRQYPLPAHKRGPSPALGAAGGRESTPDVSTSLDQMLKLQLDGLSPEDLTASTVWQPPKSKSAPMSSMRK
eukprot:gene13737-19639_t